MSIPDALLRPVALLVGVVMVCGAAAVVPNAVARTILVWAGFVPVLWALHGIWSKRAVGQAAALLAAMTPSAAEPAASASAPAPGRPAEPATPARPAAAGKPAKGSPDQRRYLALRRLTEQYLKEVRRMNLIAVWGRGGTIPRQQALNEIRQIEERMRGLTERMKFVAGKSESKPG